MNIRPATADDYPALAAVRTAAMPDYPVSAEEWRRQDEERDPKCRHGRFLAELGGEAVGYASFDQHAGMYHPRRFAVWAAVRPEHQGRGVGRALYGCLMEALAPLNPLSVRAEVREDMARGVRFMRERGFVEDMRYWESRLDVAAFDPAPFAGAEARALASGVRIASLAEFGDEEEPMKKLFDLFREVRLDVPRPEPASDITFEHFSRWNRGPNFLPEATFLAVDGERFVALSSLWKADAHDDLETGLTGVRASHRRRGLALALKLRGIGYARAVGAPRVRTGNESRNRPMLAINEALGFVRQPAWVDSVKVLKEEP